MNILTGLVIGKLANHAISRTLPPSTAQVDDAKTPVDRARERLSRAKAMAESLDAIDSYGASIAILAAGAIACGARTRPSV